MPEQLTLFDPDPLLDKHQVAQRLNVGPRFVERLIAEKRIPYIKVGRHVRVRQSTIAEFVSDNTVNGRSSASRWAEPECGVQTAKKILKRLPPWSSPALVLCAFWVLGLFVSLLDGPFPTAKVGNLGEWASALGAVAVISLAFHERAERRDESIQNDQRSAEIFILELRSARLLFERPGVIGQVLTPPPPNVKFSEFRLVLLSLSRHESSLPEEFFEAERASTEYAMAFQSFLTANATGHVQTGVAIVRDSGPRFKVRISETFQKLETTVKNALSAG